MSHTTISGQADNGVKKKEISREQNVLLTPEVRGEWTNWSQRTERQQVRKWWKTSFFLPGQTAAEHL